MIILMRKLCERTHLTKKKCHRRFFNTEIPIWLIVLYDSILSVRRNLFFVARKIELENAHISQPTIWLNYNFIDDFSFASVEMLLLLLVFFSCVDSALVSCVLKSIRMAVPAYMYVCRMLLDNWYRDRHKIRWREKSWQKMECIK